MATADRRLGRLARAVHMCAAKRGAARGCPRRCRGCKAARPRGAGARAGRTGWTGGGDSARSEGLPRGRQGSHAVPCKAKRSRLRGLCPARGGAGAAGARGCDGDGPGGRARCCRGTGRGAPPGRRAHRGPGSDARCPAFFSLPQGFLCGARGDEAAVCAGCCVLSRGGRERARGFARRLGGRRATRGGAERNGDARMRDGRLLRDAVPPRAPQAGHRTLVPRGLTLTRGVSVPWALPQSGARGDSGARWRTSCREELFA